MNGKAHEISEQIRGTYRAEQSRVLREKAAVAALGALAHHLIDAPRAYTAADVAGMAVELANALVQRLTEGGPAAA